MPNRSIIIFMFSRSQVFFWINRDFYKVFVAFIFFGLNEQISMQSKGLENCQQDEIFLLPKFEEV